MARSSVVPRTSLRGGVKHIQLRTEDREKGMWGQQPPSQGFCRQVYFGTRNFNSYGKTFVIIGILRLFRMITTLFVIANVKQLRTQVILEFYCLLSEHLGVLVSHIQQFISLFTIGLSLARFLKAIIISGEGVFEHSKLPHRKANGQEYNDSHLLGREAVQFCTHITKFVGNPRAVIFSTVESELEAANSSGTQVRLYPVTLPNGPNTLSPM